MSQRGSEREREKESSFFPATSSFPPARRRCSFWCTSTVRASKRSGILCRRAKWKNKKISCAREQWLAYLIKFLERKLCFTLICLIKINMNLLCALTLHASCTAQHTHTHIQTLVCVCVCRLFAALFDWNGRGKWHPTNNWQWHWHEGIGQ